MLRRPCIDIKHGNAKPRHQTQYRQEFRLVIEIINEHKDCKGLYSMHSHNIYGTTYRSPRPKTYPTIDITAKERVKFVRRSNHTCKKQAAEPHTLKENYNSTCQPQNKITIQDHTHRQHAMINKYMWTQVNQISYKQTIISQLECWPKQ